jgi:hypothetical protein
VREPDSIVDGTRNIITICDEGGDGGGDDASESVTQPQLKTVPTNPKPKAAATNPKKKPKTESTKPRTVTAPAPVMEVTAAAEAEEAKV